VLVPNFLFLFPITLFNVAADWWKSLTYKSFLKEFLTLHVVSPVVRGIKGTFEQESLNLSCTTFLNSFTVR